MGKIVDKQRPRLLSLMVPHRGNMLSPNGLFSFQKEIGR